MSEITVNIYQFAPMRGTCPPLELPDAAPKTVHHSEGWSRRERQPYEQANGNLIDAGCAWTTAVCLVSPHWANRHMFDVPPSRVPLHLSARCQGDTGGRLAVNGCQ